MSVESIPVARVGSSVSAPQKSRRAGDGRALTDSARYAGPEGIEVLAAFECSMHHHGLRHLGEIELARGLVGLGGMTS